MSNKELAERLEALSNSPAFGEPTVALLRAAASALRGGEDKDSLSPRDETSDEHSTPSCGACRHWASESNADHRPEGMKDVRRCNRAQMFWDCTTWTEEYERVPLPEHKDDMMFVQDGSDYHAELLTRPGFSCAHFDRKQITAGDPRGEANANDQEQ